MNKNAIKKFAIDARNKLIASVTDKAGMLGITKDGCSEPVTKGADFEVYQTAAGTEVTLDRKQCSHRRKLVKQIKERGFDAVVEEVAYTWFNRICAIRFMEVNDYMYPARVRVLSSEKAGKNEPDILTQAPDIDWDFTDEEREYIIEAKINSNQDELFRKLFIKQCNLLHEVLPGLFEETDDYTEMLLNISFTNEDDVVRMLVDGIDEKDFSITATDDGGKQTGQVEIIGWLYQYYNTEPKNKAFAKKGKITKEEVPAVTQLFTPDWIVRYMVENSLGRLWVEGHPDADLQGKWKYYLKEAEQEPEVQAELARIREEYAKLKPEDIKLVDPCMGSGHILVYAFDVFMQIYENAGWSAREAAQSIVENNIYGLDIDDRAAQLSYFAVMMKARQYDRRFLTRGVRPNVYAIQESNGINRSQLKYFGVGLDEHEKKTAITQIEELLDTMVDAKEYGSILNVGEYDWDLLRRFAGSIDMDGQISFDTYGLDEAAERLKALVEIGAVMAQKYEVVATNPPYMASSGMDVKLNEYLKKYYPCSKGDLFAVFIEKAQMLLKKHSYLTMITQQSWMFLSSYEKLREKLSAIDVETILHLGAHAFEELSGEVVQTVAFVMRKSHVLNYYSVCDRLVGVDNAKQKEKVFLNGSHRLFSKKSDYEMIPAKPYAYWISEAVLNNFRNENLGSLAEIVSGMTTGNNDIFLKAWFEPRINNIAFDKKNVNDIDLRKTKWIPYHKGGGMRKWYGNHEYVVNWSRSSEFNRAKTTMTHVYLKPCITWSDISGDSFAGRFCYGGFMFDVKGSCAFGEVKNLKLLIGIFNSKVTPIYVEALNPTTTTQVGDLKRIPLIKPDKETLAKIEENVMKCVNISQIDWDAYENSWDFKRHPLLSVIPRNSALFDNTDDIDLSECYTCWEKECNDRFKQLKANEEELNRVFIDIYGLQNELTPEVDDKDVTVRKADLKRDIKSLISYAVGCMFGRYSLNKEGLVYAGGDINKVYWKCQGQAILDENDNPIEGGYAGISMAEKSYGYLRDSEDYRTATKLDYDVDYDNIIPITDEEYFSDDVVGRFVEFVRTVFGKDSLEDNLNFIAQALGNKGDTSREVIRNYFLNDFFKDHCNTYSVTGSGKRPIYWLFDSGKQNGFKALIYMHRYDADTVGRVRTDYLHRAQKYVETAMQSAQYTFDNAASSSEKSKATKSITKYTKQLAEMQIYDEAIAHIANQRIEIDLDDGVKVNYAKFQGVEVAQEGKKALKVDLLAKI